MTFIGHLFKKWSDIISTNIRCLPACLIQWFYQLKIKKQLHSYQIEESSGKKAVLYQHGHWNSKKIESKATLILHGLYSHPCTMLHLATLAQEINAGPVFTLYLSYDEKHYLSHRRLIKQALDMIEKMTFNRSTLKGIVLVGHSIGATEAVYRAFVDTDKRILSVISIAGRLKVVNSLYSPCRDSLKPYLQEIYANVQLLTSIPLFQIVGRHDWNAPLEATLIRDEKKYSHIVEAMHFDVLFHNDIYKKFPEFLTKSFDI